MSKHAVIRTDDMFGTDNRVGIYSAKFYDSNDEPAAIDNGHVVCLGNLLEGERELYQAFAPDKGESLSNIFIVASPELMYDERKCSLDDFYNEANRPIRVYDIHSHQKWSVTKDALAGKSEPEVGDYVELSDGDTKLNVAGSQTASTTQIGHIAAIEQAGRFTFYVIEVR